MASPLEPRPQAAHERQWSGNSAHGSSEQYNGDYHNNQHHYYNFSCCAFGFGVKGPFGGLWNRFRHWFVTHHPWTTSAAIFIALAILVASITPPVYHAVEHTRANTTVIDWDNVSSTCTRHGKTICPNDRCDPASICVAEKTLTVPCWPDGECCTAACLEGWTCKEDGRCAPGLECRSKVEGSMLVSRCRTPTGTGVATSDALAVTPASAAVELATAT